MYVRTGIGGGLVAPIQVPKYQRC